jgi:hypothetical protein
MDVRHALGLFGGALAALFAGDVLFDLALLDDWLLGADFQASPSDFLGLVVFLAPVALAITLAGLAFGAAVGRLRAGAAPSRASTAAVAGAACGLTVAVVAREAGGIRLDLPGFAALAAVAALVAAGIVRAALARVPAPRAATVVAACLDAVLVGGGLALGASRALEREWVAGAFALGLPLLLVAAGRRRGAAFAVTAPLLLVAGAAGLACLRWSALPLDVPGPAAQPAAPGTPSVFLVVLDTTRADHLPVYGYGRDTMPRLSRWSRQARVFTHAIASGGWTAPSHASMLSGRTVSGHGVHFALEGFSTLPKDGIGWLPQAFSKAGYRTLAIVSNPVALPPGVDVFDAVYVPRRSAWKASSIAALADSALALGDRLSEGLRWRMPYADAVTMERIVRRVLSSGEGPVFAMINFLDPHSPYNPPADALRAVGGEDRRLFDRYLKSPALFKRWERMPEGTEDQVVDLYDGELRHLDASLGELLDWIESRFPDAVVVVTSDHGEDLGEDGIVGHRVGLSQHVIRVPLFVRAPGVEPGRSSAPVSLRRFFHFARGIAETGRVDLGLLTRLDAPGLLSERYPHRLAGPEWERPFVALIEGDLKGVGPSDQGFALFDVSDIARARPARDGGAAAERLRRRIDRYWAAERDERGAGGLSREEQERLRALGYIH